MKEQLLNNVDFIFHLTGEIKATAAELGMSPIKVKKLLITSGKLEYDETRQIQRLLAYGRSMKEIQEKLGLGKSSINSYLPYSKIPYKDVLISANADRCDLYRKRKAAVQAIVDKESLWSCIVLFAGYKFTSEEGREFQYEIVIDGTHLGERAIVIDVEGRRIPYSDFVAVYENMRNIVSEEKASIGTEDFVEIHYIYPILHRFGIQPSRF